jgi:CheY-like chemotaxis protein
MKTILIAEDEDNLRILIETTLESPDRRLVLCGDGHSAVRLAKSELPDLLVLDWMMPSMTGLDVLDILRGNASTASIPAILLTARGQEKDRSEALAAGVQAYLVKPFSPLQLLQIVHEVMTPLAKKTGTR